MELIKVIEFRFINNGSPLKAFASVQIDDWIVHDWRIIQKEGQRAWVTVPQMSWRDTDGKVRYKSLISIPGDLKQRIETKILSAWEEGKSRNGT